MTPTRRLDPKDVLNRYYDTPGHGDMKILAFANRLADYYLNAPPPTRHRPRLEELQLSTFTYGALRRAGFEFIDEIEHLSARQLLLIRNIGGGGADKIRAAIAQFRNATP